MGRRSIKSNKRKARRGVKKRRIVLNVDVAKRRKQRVMGKSGGGGSRQALGRNVKIAIAWGVVLLLLAGVLFTLGSGILDQGGHTVRWIAISGEHLFKKGEIVSLSGVRVGDNLLSISLQDVRSRICAHPDVKDAAVSRRILGGVRIKVYERFPVAAVHRGRRYVVDGEGIILSRRKERMNRALPMIVGLELDEVRAGNRLESPEAEMSLDVVKRYRDLGLCRLIELMSVDVRDPENLVLRTRAIQEIRLGSGDLSRRMDLLSYILKQRKDRGLDGTASYIDLRWNDVSEMPLSGAGLARRG